MYSDTAWEKKGLNPTCPNNVTARSQPKGLTIRNRIVVYQKKKNLDLPHHVSCFWIINGIRHLAPSSLLLGEKHLAAIELKYIFIAFICRDQNAARGMRLAEASPDSPISHQYSNSTPFNVHTQGRTWPCQAGSPKKYSCSFALYLPVINFEQPLQFHIMGQRQRERCLLLSKVIGF